MYYLLADCQGSLNVVTNESGGIVEELSYDPYGRRRNATDWTYNNLSTSYTFERGYTMHACPSEVPIISGQKCTCLSGSPI
jgi:hypothetical protein